MRSVMFNFRPDVSRLQRTILLHQIEDWAPVASAALVDPEATHPEVQRMAFVYVNDAAAVDAVVNHLNELQEVEVAFTPAERWLA